jgi:hypothetical protein
MHQAAGSSIACIQQHQEAHVGYYQHVTNLSLRADIILTHCAAPAMLRLAGC